MREKPSCDTCRKLYEKKGEHPPCEDCIPELYAQNIDAAIAWGYCQDQYIMSFGGPVAIRLTAMEAAVRITAPDDPISTLDKLIALARTIVSDINEAQENKREANKK